MIWAGYQHGAEFRRCLISLDVEGMMKLWKHVAPHLADQGPIEVLTSMHISRCEMKRVSDRIRDYSRDWLAERGYQKIDGRWVNGLPPQNAVAEAVGIAVKSRDPRVGKRIHRAMSDALDNARVKGWLEAEMQREAMLKARAKERSKLKLD